MRACEMVPPSLDMSNNLRRWTEYAAEIQNDVGTISANEVGPTSIVRQPQNKGCSVDLNHLRLKQRARHPNIKNRVGNMTYMSNSKKKGDFK